jgi:hypothetical protein
MTRADEAEPHEADTPAPRSSGVVAAFVMLAGTLLSFSGLAWDIGWHTDVGPDSFFTLPHLFIYAGGAIAGLTSLVMVLRVTAAQRRGIAPDPAVGGRAFTALGAFSAPIGYLIGGVAAASFLLYGLWDEWWHSLYGFDVTIASPPHQGWLNSICMTIMGTAIVFAAARQHRWGRYGLMVALAAFASYFSVTSQALGDVNLGSTIDWVVVVLVVIPIVCVLLGARVVPRGGAFGTAFANLALNVVAWSFANWAVVWYADVQHLALRDFTDPGIYTEQMIIPAAVFGFGAVVELLLRWRGPSALLLGLCGGVGAIVITWWLAATGDVVLTCLAAGVFAALAGAATWRLGHAMRVANTQRPNVSRTEVTA